MTPRRPQISAGQAADALTVIMGDEATGVVALPGGEWSAAFRFSSGDRTLVGRFALQREDFDRDVTAAAWSQPTMVVPAVLTVRRHDDHFVAISEFVGGSAFDELPRDDLLDALPALLQAVQVLRSIPPPGAGFGGWDTSGDALFDSWEERLLDVGIDHPHGRTAGWRAKLETVARGPELFEAGYQALRQLAGVYGGPRHIIHGDLLAGNVLVADGAVTALLDWGCSQYGDPLLDPAMLAFWEPWHPDDLGLNQLLREHHSDEVDFDDRFRACQLHIALDAMAYNAWTTRWDNVVKCGERAAELASG